MFRCYDCYGASAADDSITSQRHNIGRLTSLLEFHENLSSVNWRCQHSSGRMFGRDMKRIYIACHAAWLASQLLHLEMKLWRSPIRPHSLYTAAFCPAVLTSLQTNTKRSTSVGITKQLNRLYLHVKPTRLQAQRIDNSRPCIAVCLLQIKCMKQYMPCFIETSLWENSHSV